LNGEDIRVDFFIISPHHLHLPHSLLIC